MTSGRHWTERGVRLRTVSNQLTIRAYFLGVPPSEIAQWYFALNGRMRYLFALLATATQKKGDFPDTELSLS